MAPEHKNRDVPLEVRRQIKEGLVVLEDGKFRFRGSRGNIPWNAPSKWVECKKAKGED